MKSSILVIFSRVRSPESIFENYHFLLLRMSVAESAGQKHPSQNCTPSTDHAYSCRTFPLHTIWPHLAFLPHGLLFLFQRMLAHHGGLTTDKSSHKCCATQSMQRCSFIQNDANESSRKPFDGLLLVCSQDVETPRRYVLKSFGNASCPSFEC